VKFLRSKVDVLLEEEWASKFYDFYGDPLSMTNTTAFQKLYAKLWQLGLRWPFLNNVFEPQPIVSQKIAYSDKVKKGCFANVCSSKAELHSTLITVERWQNRQR
jgi:hypothetical protein